MARQPGDKSPTWKPVERTAVKIVGVDPQASGLLEVHIELDRDPPVEWAAMFDHPTGIGISLSMHPPRLAYDVVHIRPPDDELEKYVAHVDEQIGHANARYANEVLPRLEAQRVCERTAEAEQARRIADAQRRAGDL